ncbi:hypothetical protein CGZ98_20005 [Enemella evansiae]|uniref:hypothetical protein n=1 Tax=Enemella evansiae TaxID=2016499 RepID=UPI000B97A4B5|nr:hypothetical protein [Enemella evansiae]OYO07186.1 hypothetical protein CGZ98_20005 [Enemella evansiae]
MTIDVPTTELPTYIGDPPLFAALHLPADRQVRGGVLLCGSIAKEAADTTRGLRLLADRLARRGIAVLRFDYAGTQDSSGAPGSPTALSEWLDSIRTGYAWLRRLGVGELGLIGVRVGALLASQLTDELPDLAATVWFDPVGSGRRHLRAQGALFAMAMGATPAPEPGATHLLGLELHPDAAAGFAELSLGVPAAPLLVVRRDEKGDRRAREVGEQAEAVILDGSDELRNFANPRSFLVEIPERLIDRVVDWLAPRFGAERRSVTPVPKTTATVTGPGGIPVQERIESIGPDRMFAIRSLPLRSDPTRAVLFFATADDTHHGPAGEWVWASRRVAAAGGQALRFDRVGTGESGPVEAGELTPLYSDAARAQALAAARHLEVAGRDLLSVGVCSGSWYAASVARDLRLGKVVLVNAVAWSWVRKRSVYGSVRPEDLGVPRNTPTWQRSPRGRIKALLQRHLPYPLWRLLGQRGITQVPEVLLRPLARAEVDTVALLIDADRDWFRSQRGPEGMTRLRRRYGSRVPQIKELPGDHSAFHPAARAPISAELVAWVRAAARPADLDPTRAADAS